MKNIVINGRFLTQNITGVQRVAHEIIRELDNIVERGLIKIIAPKKIQYDMSYLKNIEVETKGFLNGHLWEQIELPCFIKKNEILVNFCNTAPIIKPSIVMIHDIQTKVHPEFFSKKFSFWYNFLHSLNIKNADKLLTVSEFSKKEIEKYYGKNSSDIEVIYNGWQHINRVEEDEEIIRKLNLKHKNFYLAVGSMSPNKNFKYIMDLSINNPEEIFVIVGNFDKRIFKGINLESKNFKNVIFTGYLGDSQLKALFRGAKVFIYPSFYEGFGIPPLEALACGTDILVSNTSCLPEIFGESANYLNPYRFVERMEVKKKNGKEEFLEKYSWLKSAKIFLEIIMERD